ncbi:MAG: hypothetical protein P4L74_07170 [Candidatus Doudnabacteria bacterium]|nr:hypothetical protein [Candidatus Doudnabacteria bacterium]
MCEILRSRRKRQTKIISLSFVPIRPTLNILKKKRILLTKKALKKGKFTKILFLKLSKLMQKFEIPSMTPAEELHKTVWQILAEIKQEQLATPDDEWIIVDVKAETRKRVLG